MQRKDVSAIISLLLVGLMLINYTYQGVNPYFDDASYLKLSQQMLNGTYNVNSSPYAYGIGFIGITALSIKLTGNPVIPEIIAFLAIICIIYLACLKLYERKVAIAVSLIAELSGFILVYSTRLLPDMLIALLISLVLYIMINYTDKRNMLFLAGLLAGGSIFIKIGGGSVFIILIIGYWILERKNTRWIVLGAIISLLIYEAVAYHYGTNILTLIKSYDSLQTSLSTTDLQGQILLMEALVYGYLIPARQFAQLFPLGAITFFSIIGTYLTMKLRYKRLYLALIFLIFSIGYMLFGTESLSDWVYLTIVSRYFSFFILPLSLLSGLLIQYLCNLYKSRTNIILVSLVIIALISNAPILMFFHNNPQFHFRF